jgi:biotin transport system substrate-specific component
VELGGSRHRRQAVDRRGEGVLKRAGERITTLIVVVGALALCAQVSVPVPGTPVPQSLQTLAVVLVGAWLGPAPAAGAVLVYIGIGAAGLPVFADGAAGLEHLRGATAGYLAGFVAGAALMGWWVGGHDGESGKALGPARRTGFAALFLGAVAAHAVILGLGWARLALMLGAGAAFAGGVAPFVIGGVAKSAVAAAIVTVGKRTRRER